VATDDRRIRDAVQIRGGQAMLTGSGCRNGTERVAEVTLSRPTADPIIDLQGDEPLMDPGAVAGLVGLMLDTPSLPMATVVAPWPPGQSLLDPSVVKAVVREGRAAAFWRLPPPEHQLGADRIWQHVGIYAFQRATLLDIASLPPSRRELDLSLEQLRAVDHGVPIAVLEIRDAWPSVNTPEDLEAIRGRMGPRTVAASGR